MDQSVHPSVALTSMPQVVPHNQQMGNSLCSRGSQQVPHRVSENRTYSVYSMLHLNFDHLYLLDNSQKLCRQEQRGKLPIMAVAC